MKIELYDVVRLIDTSGTEMLNPGTIGTILEQYTNTKTAYEVEFCDSKGFTIELMVLEQKQFILFVTEENIYKLLFKYFPEVYSEYEKESSFYCDENGTMGHIVFGDLVNNKVLELLATEQIERIKDYFYFFESMAYSDSAYVQEILVTTVIWRLGSEGSLKEYMLSKTVTHTDTLNADIERILNNPHVG
jgi:hypothetical protein